MQDEPRIRERAHQLWEQAGKPDGQHDQHWAQAEREIAGDGAAPEGQARADAQPPGGGDASDSPVIDAPDAGASPGEAAAAVEALDAPSGPAGSLE